MVEFETSPLAPSPFEERFRSRAVPRRAAWLGEWVAIDPLQTSVPVRGEFQRQPEVDGWGRGLLNLPLGTEGIHRGQLVAIREELWRVAHVEAVQHGLLTAHVHPRLPSVATIHDRNFLKSPDTGAQVGRDVEPVATDLRCRVRPFDATVEQSARRVRANATHRVYFEEFVDLRHGHLIVVDGVVYRPEEWQLPEDERNFFVAYCDRYGEIE